MGTDLTIYEKKNFKQNEKGKIYYEVEELETFSSYVAAQLCSAIYGLDDLTNGCEREIEEKDIVAADTDVAESLLMAKEELKDTEKHEKNYQDLVEKLSQKYNIKELKEFANKPLYSWTEEQEKIVQSFDKEDALQFADLRSLSFSYQCDVQRVRELTETLEELREFIEGYELKEDGNRVFLAHFSY